MNIVTLMIFYNKIPKQRYAYDFSCIVADMWGGIYVDFPPILDASSNIIQSF